MADLSGESSSPRIALLGPLAPLREQCPIFASLLEFEILGLPIIRDPVSSGTGAQLHPHPELIRTSSTRPGHCGDWQCEAADGGALGAPRGPAILFSIVAAMSFLRIRECPQMMSPRGCGGEGEEAKEEEI
ncbi:hypothetical protein NL676_032573 [Syzygium grande]|nr:hypothetical protein NL676_032573 [Syzygium grande]